MEIKISIEQGKVPVSVIHLNGDLDASSYLELVSTAQKLYEGGVQNVLLNLTDLAFIGSAGLTAIVCAVPGWHPCTSLRRCSVAKNPTRKMAGAPTKKSTAIAIVACKALSNCSTHRLK